MVMGIKKNETEHRIFYQTLMTLAFSLNTGHRYHYYLRSIIYIYILNWILMVS